MDADREYRWDRPQTARARASERARTRERERVTREFIPSVSSSVVVRVETTDRSVSAVAMTTPRRLTTDDDDVVVGGGEVGDVDDGREKGEDAREGEFETEDARSIDLRPVIGEGANARRLARDDVRELAAYGTTVRTPGRVEGLETFVNLRTLTLHACEITSVDWEGWSRLTRLEELDVSSNAVTTTRGLGRLRRLRRLSLASNALENLDGFGELSPTLEVVNVSNNRIACLNGLSRSDGAEWMIRALDARGNALTSLRATRALSELTRLESLRLKMEPGSVIGRETNEMCENASYRLTMTSLVPWLAHLDDVVVSVETSTRAMAKTISTTRRSSDGERPSGGMTPPNAERFSRTPRRGEVMKENRDVNDASGPTGTTNGGRVELELATTKRVIDFENRVAPEVRDEGIQTDAPRTRDVETQKSLDVDPSELELLRGEIDALRRELTRAETATETARAEGETDKRRAMELEATLREVRIEAAENLANLKAMYVDEQNVMLNERVNQARQESAAHVEATAEKARLLERVAAMEQELRAHTEIAVQREEDLKNSKEEVVKLIESIKSMEKEREEAEALNEELARVVESQRDQLDGFAKTREMVKILEGELENAQKAMSERKDSHHTVEAARNAAMRAEKTAKAREAKARSREEAAERLIRDVETLQFKLESADEGLQIKSDMLQHQSELIKSLKDEAVRLREENSIAAEKSAEELSDAEARLAATTGECQSLTRQVEALDVNVSELERALDAAEVDHASYERALENAKATVGERDKTISFLESQVAQLTKTLETRETIETSRNVELEMQVKELSDQLAIVREKSTVYEARAVAIREESDAMVREAYQQVEDVENEMRAVLLDMAREKRVNRERMEQIGRLLHDEDVHRIGLD